ncbi:TlpA disulfide reductase family protein [Mucilaginibacter myungsuensis]|uniref:TlpA family protein disulfide reductase n=1 Tax=Mucilaginibacter myungsuensis TaxID=649104 RepID=A0A929KTR0_9SPHI|nr:TlpA disulfide reductase family protein [Mucilaginibacter myungsuensis]MBE9661017.1 TlpA family protein disulfide reductase [Mucilaginibacter myungsuensis]MDN3597161.1 TlpA disulfide reductase family protein [Mucilaginibacter myungsuensis]
MQFKNTLFALALLITVSVASAQTPTGPRRIMADENSLVTDSSGMKYPALVWQKLVTSGDYWLRPIDPNAEKPQFILQKITEAQKAARYAKSPRPADSKFFANGGVFKTFSFKDLNGQKIQTKDWAGKTVVVNFWFIGCPPCRAEIPDLNKLALKYKDNPNVLFVAVALDQGWEVKDFIKENPLAYHLVGDGRYTAGMYEVTAYPTNVVIDKQGKVMLHYSGGYPQGPYWMDKMIQQSEAATAAQ